MTIVSQSSALKKIEVACSSEVHIKEPLVSIGSPHSCCHIVEESMSILPTILSGVVSSIGLCAHPGSGPTKAHRLHLKHVIRQFRAVEKRLASMLLKHTPAFLDLLADMRGIMGITSEIIPCYSLLLEGPDGKQFPMETVCILVPRPGYT